MRSSRGGEEVSDRTWNTHKYLKKINNGISDRTWKVHKYIKKIGDRYIYPEDIKKGSGNDTDPKRRETFRENEHSRSRFRKTTEARKRLKKSAKNWQLAKKINQFNALDAFLNDPYYRRMKVKR